MHADPSLVEAYRATRYEATAPDGERLCLRIGQLHPELDRLLQAHGVRCWAFLTAWNPYSSSRYSPEENELRQSALLADLAASGHPYWEGAGVPADNKWKPEPSVLILGLDEAGALELARKYEQNACVQGEVGKAARLLWTSGGDPLAEAKPNR